MYSLHFVGFCVAFFLIYLTATPIVFQKGGDIYITAAQISTNGRHILMKRYMLCKRLTCHTYVFFKGKYENVTRSVQNFPGVLAAAR